MSVSFVIFIMQDVTVLWGKLDEEFKGSVSVLFLRTACESAVTWIHIYIYSFRIRMRNVLFTIITNYN